MLLSLLHSKNLLNMPELAICYILINRVFLTSIYLICPDVYRTEKEMNRRKDMLLNLRSKVNQMATALNMSNFANRDSLLGPEIKPVDAMSRTKGLDNTGVVGLQRQVMKGKLPSRLLKQVSRFSMFVCLICLRD